MILPPWISVNSWSRSSFINKRIRIKLGIWSRLMNSTSQDIKVRIVDTAWFKKNGFRFVKETHPLIKREDNCWWVFIWTFYCSLKILLKLQLAIHLTERITELSKLLSPESLGQWRACFNSNREIQSGNMTLVNKKQKIKGWKFEYRFFCSGEKYCLENVNPGLWNQEYSSRNPELDPVSKFHWQRLESSTWNPQSTTVL